MRSSATSSPTSTSSSTSDGALDRLLGFGRLVHPFPSILDGLVVAGVATVAGADPVLATRLGLSMTSLQFAIGALNDLVDAPLDAGRADKPLASGAMSRRAAWVVVVAAAALGLALAVPNGPGLVALALVGLSIGVAYDLWAKGTAWSWLPFALGIPLLPVYGWYGAAGSLPGWFAGLVAMAALAGAAIAIGNARGDLRRDAASGARTVATVLGDERARAVAVVAWGVVAVVAVGWLVAVGPTWPSIGLLIVGLVVLAVGVVLGWSGEGVRRERAWEVQAAGTAIAAIGWVLGVA